MHPIANCFPTSWYELACHILNFPDRPSRMDKYEFKEGEWAWTPQDGWNKLEKVGDHFKHGRFLYTEQGYWNQNDKHATLLTIEEAEKLGHKSPRKVITKTRTVFLNVYSNSVDAFESETQALASCTAHALVIAHPVNVEYDEEETC